MSKVVRRGAPNSVYIGRPSFLGNPFMIGRDGTREEVIEKYRELFYREVSNPEFAARVAGYCKGKDLACYCTPYPCHGDIILEWLNAQT